MKILFISPSAQLGGAERVLLDTIASLRAVVPADSMIHLLALDEGPLIDAARNLGASGSIAPMPARLARIGDESGSILQLVIASPALCAYVRLLRRRVRSIDPDIIHSNGIKSHLLSRFIASAAPGAKLFWHVHDFLSRRAFTGNLLRRFSSRVTSAIAVSDAIERDVRLTLPNVPVRKMLNAIDVDHFAPGDARTAQLDRLAGFEHRDNVIRIGLVATYARWKGHAVFIDAAARAIATPQCPGLRFFIVGGPIYSTSGSQFTRAELSDRVERAGIVDHVGFVEFQPDPVEAYRALDIVVHASTSPEPFGRTIVEAMSCGRGVIATRGGGTEEIITHERDGLLVEPNDASALADAIVKLAGDPVLRDTLASAARETAVARFDRRRIGSALMVIYSQSARSGDKSSSIR